METKIIRCEYDISIYSFKIIFDTEEIVIINIEKDVDFTEFVKKLSLRIAGKSIFELLCEELEDPKQIIVFGALKEIVDSYNTILQEYISSTTAGIL